MNDSNATRLRARRLILAVMLAASTAVASGVGTSAATGGAPTILRDHQATTLADGRVLVTGGGPVEGMTTVLLYDPKGGIWSDAAPMHEPREGHSSTLLPDGRVLVIGGGIASVDADGTRTPRASAEIFDPVTGNWTPTAGSMAQGRLLHTATVLNDGRVLVVGGSASHHGPFHSSVEIFDLRTGTFTSAAEMPAPRTAHTATLLDDGRVLVVGGFAASHGTGLRDALVYDPAADTWTTVPKQSAVGRYGATATLLGDGTVLVAGGSEQSVGMQAGDINTSAEIYDPAASTFVPVPPMGTARFFQSATLLSDGRVLMVGSRGAVGMEPVTATDIFDPATRGWSAGPVAGPVESHTASLVGTRVLVLNVTEATDTGGTDSGVHWLTLTAGNVGSAAVDQVPAGGSDDGLSAVVGVAIAAAGILVLGSMAALFGRRRSA